MFDIGFWEIALIGVIALLVIGPERLPGVARNVGFWVGRMRRYVGQVRSDIEREFRADELKRIMNDSAGLDDLRSVVEDTRTAVADAGRQLDEAGKTWGEDVTPPGSPAGGASGDAGDAAKLPAAAETTDPLAAGGPATGDAPAAKEPPAGVPTESEAPGAPARENVDSDVPAPRRP